METDLNILEICNRHEEFILNELKPRLENFIKIQNNLDDEINEYKKCLTIISNMKGKDNYESYVDIGEENYVKGVLNSCNTIYIHVGMGFHVEVELDEGIEICHKRIELLQKKILNINSNIEMVGKDIQEVDY